MPGHPFFFDGPTGPLFGIHHAPKAGTVRGAVLLLPPFAEELNTCRKVTAETARALAEAGFSVLRFDLSGCGDSGGTFADSRWSHWLQDAQAALGTLIQRSPGTDSHPLWLWGVRAGALLGVDLAARSARPLRCLWWQPQLSGNQMLQQWLRLNSAQAWVAGSSTPAHAPHTPSALDRLKTGETVVAGGYPITPQLARELMALPPTQPGRGQACHWLSCHPEGSQVTNPSPPAAVAAWQAAGWDITWQGVSAPSFWLSHGTSSAPQLLQATLAALTD